MKVTYIGPSADLNIGVAVIRRDPVVELVFDDNGDVTGEVEIEPACLTVDVDEELAASLIDSGDFVAAEGTSAAELRAAAEALGIEVPPRAHAAAIRKLIDEATPATGDES